jgi:hypothetical protein
MRSNTTMIYTLDLSKILTQSGRYWVGRLPHIYIYIYIYIYICMYMLIHVNLTEEISQCLLRYYHKLIVPWTTLHFPCYFCLKH